LLAYDRVSDPRGREATAWRTAREARNQRLGRERFPTQAQLVSEWVFGSAGGRVRRVAAADAASQGLAHDGELGRAVLVRRDDRVD